MSRINIIKCQKSNKIIAGVLAVAVAIPGVGGIHENVTVQAAEVQADVLQEETTDSIPEPIKHLDFEATGNGVEADADRGNVFHYTSDECELVLDNPYGSEEIAKSLQERSEYDIPDETWKRFRGSRYQPVWEKGVTLSYWIKVPSDENGEYKNSSALRWELSDQMYYQADDYAKYLGCSFFDVEKTAEYINYSEEDYANAAKEESKVIYGSEYYFKYARYSGETDEEGAPLPEMYKGEEGFEGPVYDARYLLETVAKATGTECSKYYMYSPQFQRGYFQMTDGTIEAMMPEIHGETKNYYSQYSTFNVEDGSMIRRALVDGELQIDVDNSILWVADHGDGIQMNPNSEKDYGQVRGMQNGNRFYMNSWREGVVTDASVSGITYESAKYVALSPVSSITDYDEKTGTYTGVKNGNCDTWHQVVVTLQNDWAEFYVDGVKADVDNQYGTRGLISIDTGESFKRLNKGTGLRYAYGNDARATDFTYGNYVCRLLMDWIADEEATVHIGGSGKYGEFYNLAGTSTEFYMDDLTFYSELLTEKQIKQLYEQEIKYIGDMNQDNMLGADDTQLILKKVYNLLEADSGTDYLADVDGNGVVELTDARLHLQAITGVSQSALDVENIPIKSMDSPLDLSVTVASKDSYIVCTVKSDVSNINMMEYGIVYDSEVFEVVSSNWSMDLYYVMDQYKGVLINDTGYHPNHVVFAAACANDELLWEGELFNIAFKVKDVKKLSNAKPVLLVPDSYKYQGDFTGADSELGTISIDLSEMKIYLSDDEKDADFYDEDGVDGIVLADAQAILKHALRITSSHYAYTLADAQKCLKIALKIETLE